MDARKLFHFKDRQGDFLIEMVIWELPTLSKERPHGLKYRMYCGRADKCIVRYDNGTGKGDHRHYGLSEESYHFESLEKLIEDFRNDCSRLADWRWES